MSSVGCGEMWEMGRRGEWVSEAVCDGGWITGGWLIDLLASCVIRNPPPPNLFFDAKNKRMGNSVFFNVFFLK